MHGPNQQAQPLLRWAGSKKRQFQTLKEYFPEEFETYAEPFAGSAAFLFRMGPSKAKISDINADLYDFYSACFMLDKSRYGEFSTPAWNRPMLYRATIVYRHSLIR